MTDDEIRQSGDLILLRTKAGRIHRAVQMLDGVRFVDERCQLDDAPGRERVITWAELETADGKDVCRNCWPVGTDGVPA